MAKISGRLGKSSGSPSGSEEFEQEFYLTNVEAATLLRDLAQEMRQAVGLKSMQHLVSRRQSYPAYQT